MQETWVQSLGLEDPLEKDLATHSSILAWEIPWTEEAGRVQSMGSQRVRRSQSDSAHTAVSVLSICSSALVFVSPVVLAFSRNSPPHFCFLTLDYLIILFYFILFYWLHSTWILVLWTGIERMPTAMEVLSLNHWTPKKSPLDILPQIESEPGFSFSCDPLLLYRNLINMVGTEAVYNLPDE